MNLVGDIGEFGAVCLWYLNKKTLVFGAKFDGAKSLLVGKLITRRGAYQRPFLHFGMFSLIILGLVSAPLFINQYPTKASANAIEETPSSILNTVTATAVKTVESEKPRRDIVEYTIQKGDTLSGIAKNYGVDTASIKALNPKLSINDLSVGTIIKVPPVSGVIIMVKKGDTVNALAKKYGLESAQPIADWPYNSFANDETFELAAGQSLVIPGGVMPEEAVRPVYQTTPGQTLFARGTGALMWPAGGTITQRFTWYHNGIDIANGIGTSIIGADSGRVVVAERSGYNGGYGKYIKVDHGNGLSTLYAHLSEVSVSVGDNISRGQLIGKMGSTGRSTGSHLHFAVFSGDNAVNPAGLLK
jgi:murein DD-endopeptidase MepM/ murein hydrolase activator NlpD